LKANNTRHEIDARPAAGVMPMEAEQSREAVTNVATADPVEHQA